MTFGSERNARRKQAWPFHSTRTLKEAAELVAKHCMEKQFQYTRKIRLTEFWVWLDPSVVQGDLQKAVKMACEYFQLS